jgi:hypothetical protein
MGEKVKDKDQSKEDKEQSKILKKDINSCLQYMKDDKKFACLSDKQDEKKRKQLIAQIMKDFRKISKLY